MDAWTLIAILVVGLVVWFFIVRRPKTKKANPTVERVSRSSSSSSSSAASSTSTDTSSTGFFPGLFSSHDSDCGGGDSGGGDCGGDGGGGGD